jgi:hypothetical protein
MSISVTYVSQATVVETLEGEFVGTDDTVTTNGLNTSETLGAGSTPPATKYSAGSKALSSGSATIDLTSLPDANGTAGAVTLTGLKLAVAKFRNKSTNANAMTIVFGASNPCTSLGAAFNVTLQPGEELTYRGKDLAADIDSTHKTFDVTGTGAQVLEFEFVAG